MTKIIILPIVTAVIAGVFLVLIQKHTPINLTPAPTVEPPKLDDPVRDKNYSEVKSFNIRGQTITVITGDHNKVTNYPPEPKPKKKPSPKPKQKIVKSKEHPKEIQKVTEKQEITLNWQATDAIIWQMLNGFAKGDRPEDMGLEGLIRSARPRVGLRIIIENTGNTAIFIRPNNFYIRSGSGQTFECGDNMEGITRSLKTLKPQTLQPKDTIDSYLICLVPRSLANSIRRGEGGALTYKDSGLPLLAIR